MTTEMRPIKRREITAGTKEWADYNVNCIKGCSNDCRYCYAKIMAKRFGRCQEDTWKNMSVNKNATDRNYGKYKGRVMFPSTHDITDNPEIQEACFTVIFKLLEAGNEVLITTKPKLTIVQKLLADFKPFKEYIQFRFTITSFDNLLLNFWEPNAPVFEERLESLKYAYENEFKTSVSIEPFLDRAPQILVNKLSLFVTESIWIGPMNYISRNCINNGDNLQYEEIRKNYDFDNLHVIYKDLKNLPIIRFKDSMINRLFIR